jgi:hypothetical protein
VRHFAGWIVVRTILVADVGVLIVCGFISLIWVAAPSGVVWAAVVWLVAGALLGLLPFTDPYRAQERRWRRRASREVTPDNVAQRDGVGE